MLTYPMFLGGWYQAARRGVPHTTPAYKIDFPPGSINGPSFVCPAVEYIVILSSHWLSNKGPIWSTPSDMETDPVCICVCVWKTWRTTAAGAAQNHTTHNKLKDLWHTFLFGLWIPLTRDAYHVTRPLLLSMSTLGSLRPIRVGSQRIYLNAVKRWFHLEWGALDGGSGWSREWWAWITRWGLVISFVFKWRSNAPN